MSTCALWEEQRLSSQDKEPKLRLSLVTRVAEDVTVICCKGRIAHGIEAAALSDEIAGLAPQTRRVVIDLSGVEMIDAAGLGALISVASTAQASQCSVKLVAPSNLIRQLLELTKLTRFRSSSYRGCRHRRIPRTSGMTDRLASPPPSPPPFTGE
jgi:anti-anti-sigma factor